ncbi:TetR family transcriptional regulator [Microtetraspora sp. AC03309]|uniref:TetR family transcriptional regulator n=1 Tax=Microtetraspora sp. AC03309 TaxID=2779376 RepID=UPI001E4174A9|nr:TetR family transcriptional regulator [Microtetraspora sp. AC03309]MCC5574059.1 TetR family transcriptional regulator [Microtetraspora sp. AC03309]
MGLRERKKQKTRIALIDAALDLFLTQGYDITTIDQVAAVVDVSPRTFFRYFSSKEEAALSLPQDGLEILLAEFAARPAAESPHQALSNAMRVMLDTLREGDAAEARRFLQARQLIGSTPTLLAGQMCLMATSERRLAEEVARRRGTDPDDLHTQFVVSVFTALGRICFEHGPDDLSLLAERLEQTLAIAERCLRPGWDR